MCKFCLGMLTGVFVCLTCAAVGIVLLNRGISRTPRAPEEIVEPLPELSEPVPVSSEPTSTNPLPFQGETPQVQMPEPLVEASPLPVPVVIEGNPGSIPVTTNEVVGEASRQTDFSISVEPPATINAACLAQLAAAGGAAVGVTTEPLPDTPVPVEKIALPAETPPPPLATPPVSFPPPAMVGAATDPQEVPQTPTMVQATWVPATTHAPPEPIPALPASAAVSVSGPGEPPIAPAEPHGLRMAVASAVVTIRPLPTVRTPLAGTTTEGTILTGTYPCSVDDGRQIKLPQAARELLGESPSILVTPGPCQCLLLCSPADLAQMMEQLDRAVKDDEAACALRRLYFAQTEKCVVDADGRIAISERLAEFAGLRREAVVVGVGDHLELWDTERWQQYLEQRVGAEPPATNR